MIDLLKPSTLKLAHMPQVFETDVLTPSYSSGKKNYQLQIICTGVVLDDELVVTAETPFGTQFKFNFRVDERATVATTYFWDSGISALLAVTLHMHISVSGTIAKKDKHQMTGSGGGGDPKKDASKRTKPKYRGSMKGTARNVVVLPGRPAKRA